MIEKKESTSRLAIFTPDFLIIGYVKMKLVKIGDNKIYSRRISDLMNSASERMARAGEPDFLELQNAYIRDLRSRKVLRRIKDVVVNRSAIRFIIRAEYVSQTEDGV
jgi:hypothetical protein